MGEISIRVAPAGLLQTNCYFVINEELKEGFIVDPGGDAPFLKDCVNKLEFTPAAILLTHAHFDHIGAVEELREYYKIPVYVHEKDVEMLENSALNMGMTEYHLKEDDVILKGREELMLSGINVEVIHTPGHTPGGVCYYIKEKNALLSGDTMFRFSWGRTDFPGGSEKALMESIREKLLPLPEKTLVYPGHEGPTRIGDERRVHGFK